METPKKYTFALVEVKWVFISMDFSKIAVLFLCILIFVFFATKKSWILRHFWINFHVFDVFDGKSSGGRKMALRSARRRCAPPQMVGFYYKLSFYFVIDILEKGKLVVK